ncbi:MAG: hypothetical protein KME50_10495 [Nostoc desertorum CM1-VF14]|nr:hypothetical protein [Nostoc desertorum CM1-VF14]
MPQSNRRRQFKLSLYRAQQIALAALVCPGGLIVILLFDDCSSVCFRFDPLQAFAFGVIATTLLSSYTINKLLASTVEGGVPSSSDHQG